MEIYLIYRDDADDCCDIKGYIIGTEEDAAKYVEELNKDAEYIWEECTWIKLEKLN